MKSIRNAAFLLLLGTIVFGLRSEGLRAYEGTVVDCDTWNDGDQEFACTYTWSHIIWADGCSNAFGGACTGLYQECGDYCYFNYNLNFYFQGPCSEHYDSDLGKNVGASGYCFCGCSYGCCS
jgi:hypothetical protein